MQLQWTTGAAQAARSSRLQVEHQIRALVPEVPLPSDARAGGDETTGTRQLLKRIRAGETEGDLSILGRIYRHHWRVERELREELARQVRLHASWSWLQHVHGLPLVPTAVLLARLDIRKAQSPSSFWAYCGLGTIAAVAFECDTCGLRVERPAGGAPAAGHLRKGDGTRCPGSLRPVRGAKGTVRVAPTRFSGTRNSPAFDLHANQSVIQVVCPLVRRGGPYSEYRDAALAELDERRPNWPDQRRRATALRKTQKAFLLHLWLIWRERAGLPLTQPFPRNWKEGAEAADPWTFVGVDRGSARAD